MGLRPEEIYLYARHAGFSPDQAVTMTAIALAESGGNVDAHNPIGEDSRGLWQVNLASHTKFVGLDATDPLTNARMAFEVSAGGADIGRWTVTHADKGARYLQFREQAEAASRALGEDGVGQWDPPQNYHSPKVGAGPGGDVSPPPLPANDTGAAAEGAEPSGDTFGQDSDDDGLLDQYERLVGTDPMVSDTDRDGFTDSDEIIRHGTSPLEFGDNPLGATGEYPAPPSPGSAADAAAESAAETRASATEAVSSAPGAFAPLQATGSPMAAQPGAVAPGPLDTFLDAALSQDGDPYIFGAEAGLDEVDPDAFDCSELVEWAAAQAGVEIQDGSFNQYLQLKGMGSELTVEEAIRTPGALLFSFSSTPVPGGGRPPGAHVAISLGDGRTIEARGRAYGVGSFDADGRSWTHAGYIPDLGTELSSVGMAETGVVAEQLPYAEDSDGDGLLDLYERLIGTDPFSADTDRDGFVDAAEVIEHGTDPLDYVSNPLDPTSGPGEPYRPPLTTDLRPPTAPGGAGDPLRPGRLGDTRPLPGPTEAPPAPAPLPEPPTEPSPPSPPPEPELEDELDLDDADEDVDVGVSDPPFDETEDDPLDLPEELDDSLVVQDPLSVDERTDDDDGFA